MVLAKSAAGDLAVAYLPENDGLEVDVSAFPAPLASRWFDPVRGRYTSIADGIENRGIHRFVPPAPRPRRNNRPWLSPTDFVLGLENGQSRHDARDR